MAQKHGGNAGTKKRIKVIRAVRGNQKRAHYDDAVQPKQNQNADKPPFLGIRGKNKICLIFRQVKQLALRPISDSLSRELSASDGDGGLIRVIPASAYVGQRMDEREYSLFLVRMEAVLPQAG